MRRKWLRLALLVVFLGASVAAGSHAFLTGQSIAESRLAARAFDVSAWTLAISLADLRAAQRAYVATGQDHAYWMADVSERIEAVTAGLSSLSAASTLPVTGEALDEAMSLVGALARMDVRARDHAEAGEELMASDLIFADGLELSRSAADQVDRARLVEREARDDEVGVQEQSRVVAVGAAFGSSLLFALLLSPLSAARTPARTVPTSAGDLAAEVPEALPEGRLFLDLDSDDGNRTDATEANLGPSATPAPDLRLAADLCTDLVRSADATELPQLLSRAAQLLNASCIIVWVRDGTGNALRPAIAHGYPATALARLGTIPCDADNATAAAYREARMKTVPGGAETSGAIVAPLASSEHSPGVMSLEVNDGWEASADVQATATIIAAQLATFVAADPADAAAGQAQA
jgi:hypothetical protein